MFTSDRIRYHTVSVSPIFLSTHTPVVGDHSSNPTPQCYCQGVSRADQVFLCHLLCHISTVSVVD